LVLKHTIFVHVTVL